LPKLLSPGEVAAILGCEIQSLSVWRSTQRYDLPWIKIGSRVMYKYEDVTAFIENNRHDGGGK
jgi:hypothetical protein